MDTETKTRISETLIETHKRKRAAARSMDLAPLQYTKRCTTCGEVKQVDLREPTRYMKEERQGYGDFPVEKRVRGDGSVARYAKGECRACMTVRVARWREGEEEKGKLKERQDRWNKNYKEKSRGGKGHPKLNRSQRRQQLRKKKLALEAAGATLVLDAGPLLEWLEGRDALIGREYGREREVISACRKEAVEGGTPTVTASMADRILTAYARPDLLHVLWD